MNCLKEIDSFPIKSFNDYEMHRNNVLKKYGFTMEDFFRACRLTESNTKNKFEESTRTYKEKHCIKEDTIYED